MDQYLTKEVRNLLQLAEKELQPLAFAREIPKALEALEKAQNADVLNVYIPALKKNFAVQIIKSLPKYYKRMTMTNFNKLFSFFGVDKAYPLLLECNNYQISNATLDETSQSIVFNPHSHVNTLPYLLSNFITDIKTAVNLMQSQKDM